MDVYQRNHSKLQVSEKDRQYPIPLAPYENEQKSCKGEMNDLHKPTNEQATEADCICQVTPFDDIFV